MNKYILVAGFILFIIGISFFLIDFLFKDLGNIRRYTLNISFIGIILIFVGYFVYTRIDVNRDNTIKCYKCKREIPTESNICPYCSEDLKKYFSPVKYQNIYKKIDFKKEKINK